jgi:transcriptional regulator with XRE-family HTH domain
MLGDEIRKARLAKGLTQEKLAFRAKVSRNYISLVELEQNSPTVDVLLRIAEGVGVKASGWIAAIEQHKTKRKR